MLHEAGHYFAAKRAGMKVTEFFLGFGPRVWSFRRGETEYGVKAIPAGGYVRIVGMSNLEEVDPDEEPRTFRHGTFGNRLTVILAGVTVNLILAFLLIYVALIGRGLPDTVEASVSRVLPESPAAEAGIRDGDRIIAIDGQRLDVDRDIGEALSDRVGQPTTIVVERDGGTATVTAVPKERSSSDKSGIIGVSVGQSVSSYRSFNPIEAVPESFSTIGQMTRDTGAGIGRLFSPDGIERYSKNFTGDAPKQGTPAENERPRSHHRDRRHRRRPRRRERLGLLFLLGGHQPHRRPVQPHPAAALRRRARRGRHLRAGRVQDPGPRGAGRLPQACSGDRARARRLPHARSVGDVPRHPPDLQRILIASTHARFARSDGHP